jgi:CheY-specific phosphatase CheX
VSQELATRLDDLVVGAALALFESVGVHLERQEPPPTTPPDHDMAASIGFVSAEVRGALAITTRRELVMRAWPKELGAKPPSETAVADWCGELSNQLMGRLKNRLLEHGLALEQGTPSVVTGWQLHRSPSTTNLAKVFAFKGEASSLLVYLDMEVPDGFRLAEGGERPATEGNVVLFAP